MEKFANLLESFFAENIQVFEPQVARRYNSSFLNKNKEQYLIHIVRANVVSSFVRPPLSISAGALTTSEVKIRILRRMSRATMWNNSHDPGGKIPEKFVMLFE